MVHQDRTTRGNNRPVGRRRITAVGGVSDNTTGALAGNHHILRSGIHPANRVERNESRVRHRGQGQLVDPGGVRIRPANSIIVDHKEPKRGFNPAHWSSTEKKEWVPEYSKKLYPVDAVLAPTASCEPSPQIFAISVAALRVAPMRRKAE